MEIIIRKIFGWVILCIGLIAIFWILLSSYNIFTGKTEVPVLFEAEKQEEVKITSESDSSSEVVQDLEKQAEKIAEGQVKEQLERVIPSEFVARIFNLISWAIFATLVVFASAHIAGLGVKLLKT